ncbi:MAG: hypothetical protein ACR2M5_17575 [Nakamurella sp.]
MAFFTSEGSNSDEQSDANGSTFTIGGAEVAVGFGGAVVFLVVGAAEVERDVDTGLLVLEGATTTTLLGGPAALPPAVPPVTVWITVVVR